MCNLHKVRAHTLESLNGELAPILDFVSVSQSIQSEIHECSSDSHSFTSVYSGEDFVHGGLEPYED
jgi:hypothetical protein